MIKDIIITLPLFVCLFWAVTLYMGFRNLNTSKKILALFMAVSTLLYTGHAIYFSMNYMAYTVLDPLYTFANLSVFPIFLIYIRSLTKTGKIERRLYWLFIPALLFSLTSAMVYLLLPKPELLAYIKENIYKESTQYTFSSLAVIQSYSHIISRISFAVLLIPSVYLSWKYIIIYESKIKEFYSDTESKSLKWAAQILTATVLSAILAITLNILGKSYFIHDFTRIIVPSLLFSSLLYVIGYLGYNQSFAIKEYEIDLAKEKKTNNINNTRSKLHSDLINLLENEQLFRNPDLRITDISSRLNTNRTYISGIVNTEFNTTFCDLINHYRIEFSKKLLLDQNLYILHCVAEESGFASVNSYMRAFKKSTGMTPGQFRKKAAENN